MASKEGDAATDAPNSHRLAHDLSNADVWRSTDISLQPPQQQQQRVEIITPKLMMTTAGDGLTSTAAANRVKKFTPVTASNSVNNNSNTTTFSSLKIHPQLVEDLRRCGFTRPSPIQSTALPLGRLGIDLIAQSKSGTGKTLVFVICALEMVLIEAAEDAAAASKPMAIIVAPTREIALQIGSIIDALTSCWTTSRGIPFSCYKAIGGTKVSEHLGQLATSAVVVGTPGRLCCLLEMDLLPAAAVRLLVLDECDKLVGEESFRRQIDKLYGRLPASKQMIVTSATLSEPLTLFLARYMANTAEDGGGGGPALVRLAADSPALVGVSQLVHRTAGHPLDYLNFEAKIGPLVALLRAITFRQAVIFSNYQTRAKYLLERLQQQQQQQTDTGAVASKSSKADRPLWTAALISGDMAQRERAEAIAAFRRHRVRLLISTDLTARGIDVESVNLVVNVDVPLDGETYLHRVGRAGRFGSAGLAITLLGNEADVAAFEAIRAQYPGLEVRPLTLPLTVSPWAVFYEGRGLGGGGHKGGVAVADICKQGGGLPVNELFAEMVAGIAELSEEEEEEEEEFIGHNQTAVKEEEGEKESDKQSPEVVSVSQRQSGDTFTATTTTITDNNLNCDLQSTTIELEDHELEKCSSEDRDDDGQAEKEESDLQVEQQQQPSAAAAVFNLSEVSAVQLPAVNRKIGRNGSSSSNNNSIHLDHRQVHVQRPPQPPPTLTSTLTATTTSVQQQQQFKNAFLRPISSPFALFSYLKPSNVAICKYLLHGGGGGGDLNNKNISPQHYQNQPHANISSHR